jgi:hypothetical protein
MFTRASKFIRAKLMGVSDKYTVPSFVHLLLIFNRVKRGKSVFPISKLFLHDSKCCTKARVGGWEKFVKS